MHDLGTGISHTNFRQSMEPERVLEIKLLRRVIRSIVAMKDDGSSRPTQSADC